MNASSSLNAKTPTTDSLSSSDSQSVGTPVENGGTVHIEGYDFEQAMSSLHLDEEDDEYGEDDYGFSPSLGVVSEVPVEEDSAVDYWADYGKAVEELIDEDLCPSHGKLCRKGICQDYAAKKRQEKFEKRRKEIEDEKKRKKKGKDGADVWLLMFTSNNIDITSVCHVSQTRKSSITQKRDLIISLLLNTGAKVRVIREVPRLQRISPRVDQVGRRRILRHILQLLLHPKHLPISHHRLP